MQVYKEIELGLSKNFTDFFIAFHLSAIVDNLSGKYENWVKNEEFIKGKIREGFIQGPPQYFVISKGKEERRLTVDDYIDALLFNWQNAIDEQNDYALKLNVLNNARLAFSAIKYHYPVEDKIKKVEERLDVIEKNINYYKDKKDIYSDKHKIEKATSYIWTGERKKLQSMYRELKKNLVISNDTDINTFLFFYTGKPEKVNNNPIQWLKSTRLLAYMLFILHNKGMISNSDWQSISGRGKFYINRSGKIVKTNDLAKAVSDCGGFNQKPDGFEVIDKILSIVI